MISECRAAAREKLSGKWGKSACTSLVYSLVIFLINVVQGLFPADSFLSSVVAIGIIVIDIPLSFGLIYSFYKIFNGDDISVVDFFNLGFSNFKKAWTITLQITLKILVPIILIIVSMFLLVFSSTLMMVSPIIYSSSSSGTITGLIILLIGFVLFIASSIWAITKSYYYVLSYFIAFDNMDKSSKEIVEESKKLMINNRAKFFGLMLSFIGWAILAVFTFGIGYLWLTPYIMFSAFCFYKKLQENNI